MNAATILRNRLSEYLSDQAGSQESHFDSAVDDVKLTCEFSRIDGLASGLNRLSISKPVDFVAFPRRKKACDQLSTKLHYLLEPVRVIEVDAEANVIQMRSDPPQDSEQARRYYELVANADNVVLARYEKTANCPRRIVPCIVTHEVLGRMIDDLIGVLD